MKPLTRLERYGWERLAEMRLGISRGEARMLAYMVLDAPGRNVSHDFLRDMLQSRPGTLPASCLMTKPVQRVRASLSDLGVTGSITTVYGFGYLVAPDDADAIRQYVESEE